MESICVLIPNDSELIQPNFYERLHSYEKNEFSWDDVEYDEAYCSTGDGGCILKIFEVKLNFLETMSLVKCSECIRKIFPECFRPDPVSDPFFVYKLRRLRNEIGIKEFTQNDMEMMNHNYFCTCDVCIKPINYTDKMKENYKNAKNIYRLYFS